MSRIYVYVNKESCTYEIGVGWDDISLEIKWAHLVAFSDFPFSLG